MPDWIIWYVALPLGGFVGLLKLYAIAEFQRSGRYRILESLDWKSKNIVELNQDASIPRFTRFNLWLNLRAMNGIRLVGIGFEDRRPDDPPTAQRRAFYYLLEGGKRVLAAERAKRTPSAPDSV